MTEVEEQTIEYVEYLDTEEYDENQDIVAVNDESIQEIEYIEAEEINCKYELADGELQTLDGHTIFEHNGKQYMIPSELHQNGQTIVLENFDDGDENAEYLLHNDDDATDLIRESQDEVDNIEQIYYKDAEGEVEDATSLLEQSAEVETSEENQILYRDEAVMDEAECDEDENCYMVYGQDDSGEATVVTADEMEPLSRRYAVLRDGRLHIQTDGVSEEDEVDAVDDYQDKLHVLEESLNNYRQESDEAAEITGKNLITGQTISLTGFLEKLKRKAENPLKGTEGEYYPPSIKKQRQSYYKQTKATCVDITQKSQQDLSKSNYVLMPPVNRKVVVGKTTDGKNIVGKILQIWKKVDPNAPKPKPRTVKRRSQKSSTASISPVNNSENLNKGKVLNSEKIEELIIDNTGKILHVENLNEAGDNASSDKLPKHVILKKKYVSKAFLNQNIVKTLSGLMELESVQKNLQDKNLIIKHIFKKSVAGKIIPDKEITYYYGHMEKNDIVDCFNEVKTQWTFVSDYHDELEDHESLQQSPSIDLTDVPADRQQVEAQVTAAASVASDGKVTFGFHTAEPPDVGVNSEEGTVDTATRSRIKIQEFEETVAVNLIVIEDEFGKKRTKVTIPQLGAAPRCQICNKLFRTEQQLRRHAQFHRATDGNFSCDICKRTFNDIATLFRHSRIHMVGNRLNNADEQDYTCLACNKSFTSPGSLKRHLTVHDPSLRPLQCCTCLQRFTDQSSLKKHMLLHTGRLELPRKNPRPDQAISLPDVRQGVQSAQQHGPAC